MQRHLSNFKTLPSFMLLRPYSGLQLLTNNLQGDPAGIQMQTSYLLFGAVLDYYSYAQSPNDPRVLLGPAMNDSNYLVYGMWVVGPLRAGRLKNVLCNIIVPNKTPDA